MLDKDKKINELLANKEFFKKITSMKTIEEVVDAFKEENVEISVEEVQEIGVMINEVMQRLNEKSMENVSGGGEKFHQFKQGYTSGVYGPVWAYGYMGSSNYDEPKTKGEKAARYAGIAIGVLGSVVSAGIPWIAGSAKEFYSRDDFKNKENGNGNAES